MSLPGSSFHRVMQCDWAVQVQADPKGPEYLSGSLRDKVRAEHIDHYMSLIKDLPKFMLTRESLEVMREQEATGGFGSLVQGLVENDLFHLPMESLIIERVIKDHDNRERTIYIQVSEFTKDYVDQSAGLAGQLGAQLPGTLVAHWFVMGVDEDKEVKIPCVALRLIPQKGEFLMHTFNTPWWGGSGDEHGWHKYLGTPAGEQVRSLIMRTVIYLVVLMGTRGITKTEVAPVKPSRLDRLRSSKKTEVKAQRYSHTVIDVHPAVRHLTGKTYRNPVTGRSSPRLHWRIGHARRVVYGKGRTERRWEWFPPCLVGFDSQGKITHDYKV